MFAGCGPQSTDNISATMRTSHSFTSPSASHDAMTSPFVLNVRWFTEFRWPYSVCAHKPVRMSQRLTVLSLEPVAKLFVNGCQHTSLTESTCPLNASRHRAVCRSHKRTL